MRFWSTLICLTIYSNSLFGQNPTYPESKTVNVLESYFGKRISDPYRWLEYDTAAEVKDWYAAQSQFAEKFLKKNTTYHRMNSALEYKYSYRRQSLTRIEQDYFYYRSGSFNSVDLYYQAKSDDPGQLVIHPARYGKHKSISFFTASRDRKNVAIGLSEAGSDWDEVHIKNLQTNTSYPETIKGIKFGAVAWRSNGFYYSRYPLPQESEWLTARNVNPKIYYHKLGEDQRNDQLIYTENSPNFIDAETTDDERILVIYGNDVRDGHPYSKLLYIDFNEPAMTTPRVFLNMPKAHISVVDNLGDSLVIVSDYGAPTKRVLICNPKRPNKLRMVVPEFKEPLDQVTIIDHKLVCLYRQNADYICIIYDLTGKAVYKLDFPVGAAVSGFDGKKDDTKTTYSFETFTLPTVAFELDLKSLKIQPTSNTRISFDYTNFITRKDFYLSKDGTKIPIYIVHKKNVKVDGKNPCLLYGYGGFGRSMTPFYDPGLAFFLDSGGVLAAPCIRGGGEFGEEWHKAGSVMNKQNSFDDFIAAAEYMIKANYTKPTKLAMIGMSNGGLLVGAVMTQRPDLFKAVVAQVGVFDMLRYQNYTIGHGWGTEYGLSSDSVQFENLMKYSPLHNVRQVKYPATLLITGDHDDRVPPMHSYKFAAALQKANVGPNPILLLVEKYAGHNGPEQYQNYLTESTFVYGFIMSELSGDD